MNVKAPKGSEVILYFDDHVEDGEGLPLSCIVRGKLVSRGPKHVTVESWTCIDPTANPDNCKRFTILTSCVRGYAVCSQSWVGQDPGAVTNGL